MSLTVPGQGPTDFARCRAISLERLVEAHLPEKPRSTGAGVEEYSEPQGVKYPQASKGLKTLSGLTGNDISTQAQGRRPLGRTLRATGQCRCAEQPGAQGLNPAGAHETGERVLWEHVGRSTGQRLLLTGGRAAAKLSLPSPRPPARAPCNNSDGGSGAGGGGGPSLSPAAWACLPTSTLQANPGHPSAPGSPSHHLPQTACSYSQGNQARENAAVTTPEAARESPPQTGRH